MMTLVNLDKWNTLTKAQKDLLENQARIYEKDGDEILFNKEKIYNDRMRINGMQTVKLKGKVKSAYLNTIYGSKWAEVDDFHYNVDYESLKRKMYTAQHR